jgi:hypothetical protein
MSGSINVGDMVSVIGDLKMGTVTEILKESSGEARKVKIQFGEGASGWYTAQEVQKLLLG